MMSTLSWPALLALGAVVECAVIVVAVTAVHRHRPPAVPMAVTPPVYCPFCADSNVINPMPDVATLNAHTAERHPHNQVAPIPGPAHREQS